MTWTAWTRATALPVTALALVLATAACTGDRHPDDRARYTDDGARYTDDARTVSAPVGDLREATLDVVSGADAVTIQSADLGDDLFAASTAQDSRVRPSVSTAGGTVTFHLVDAGSADAHGAAAANIRLSSKVRWTLHLDGGAAVTTIDFGGGQLREVDLVAGSNRIDLRLPSPQGTLLVRMLGGASAFDVRVPAGAPARVRVSGGAGSVLLDSVEHTGVSGSTVYTPPGWDGAADRYDIDAVAGVSALSLVRAG